MFNSDLIERARWDELYVFFTSGDPPLVLRLLVINTIFMVLLIIRSAKAKQPLRPTTTYIVQGLLIASNFAVAFQDVLMPWALRLKTFV
jgi:hypothetical protein